MAKKIFLSYDYQNDFDRANQIRQMGIIKDIKPASFEEWAEICRQGPDSIKKWIDDNMANADAVVVLIGEDTVHRRWVRYEIEKSWNEGKGLIGIYIHNLYDHNKGQCQKGENPFEHFKMNRDNKSLRKVIKCYDPEPTDAYTCIYEHILDWIDEGEVIREFY